MSTNQPRKPSGTPAGGQWAPVAHEEVDIELRPAHYNRVAVGAIIGVAAIATLAPTAAAATANATDISPAEEIGIVPPGNPASNCTPRLAYTPSEQPTKDSVLRATDICRRQEGVGPIVLPSNWTQLTPAEQMFVVVDLERVNRGEQPITGLNSNLDALARTGAQQGIDPVGPNGFTWGSVWGGWQNAFATIEMMMYDDGVNSPNEDCISLSIPGCWVHRDILLSHLSSYDNYGNYEFVAGASCAVNGCAMLIVVENAPVWFSWANELRHFARPPKEEPGTTS